MPVFKNISKDLERQLAGPLAKASKSAGESLEKGVGQGADNAAKAVERAQYRVLKSTQELETAESKLTEQKLKSEAADKAVEAAARKRAEAEGKGVEAVEKAEQDLLKKRAAAEKAARDLASAEQGVERAMAESANAAKSLEDRQKALENATIESADATKKFGEAADGADGSSGRFELSLGKVAAAAAVVGGAVAAAGTAAYKLGSQFDDAYDTIRIGTGASGEAFEGLQDSMRKVAGESIGVGSDLGEIGSTLADLNTRLGVTGKPLEELTTQFQQLKGMGIEADINAVTGAFTQFGVQVDDMPGMMDTIFQISQATGRSMNDLVGNLTKSGPALQEFGFGLEESAGLLGALDKAGLDSEKTLGSMTKALGEFAKDGKDPQEALWGTIQQIDDLTRAGRDVEAIDLANSIFGAKGGAGFVAAVRAGKFEYDDFLQSIGASGDTISGVAEETADFAEKWDQFKNRASLALEPIATQVFDLMVPALESLASWIDTASSKFQTFGEWVQRNNAWLGPLVAAVGAAVGVWAAWTGAIMAWQTAVKIATGVQVAFNAVMAANPIMLATMAIAALAAGLTYFFTQTETGKAVWEAFTTAITNGWNGVVETVTAGWNWLRDSVFIPLGIVVDLYRERWQLAFALAVEAWNAFTGALSVGWEFVKAAVFDALIWYIGRVQENWQIVTGVLSAAWQAFASGIAWAWENVIRPTWDALGAALTWLWGNVFSPALGWMADRWNWMSGVLDAGRVFIVDAVFGGLQRGLDTLRGWFQTAVDAITRIWDGIRAAAARPVRFVVDTVFNNGIRKAWNAVAKFTGLEELGEVALGGLGAYAHGGVLPGYTPGRDPYTFVEPRTGMRIGLSGGEAIMRPEVTRALGVDNVDGLNAAARMGGVSAVQRYLGGFASGGVIGSISDAVRKFFPMMTITSTLRPGDPGWHGKGKAVDFSNGTDTTPQMRAAAQWFYANYGPGLYELIHSPFNNNVKNGKNVGDGFGLYGAGTMNAHRNHVHVAAPGPLGDPSVMVEMLEDAGSGSGFSLFSMVKGLWDKAIGAIGKWGGPGLIGQLPGAMLSKLADAAWNTIKEAAEKAAAMFGGVGGSAGNAESWREMAMWAMRREGFNADDPAQVNAMLKQIMSESGGNPGIAQQIVDVNGTGENAGVGLLQIIPGTFATYRDPSLPNDRRDPQANMVAALRYYKARYGMDLTTTWGHGHGYARGGVLPGFTPGRDVHKFFSPTGGALALSGGEAIMVPEWTRAVGGPAAVAAMNRAASGGRAGGSAGAFAGGGVWGVADDYMAQFRDATANLNDAAGKLADASSYEGIAARAGLSKFGEFASALGFDGTSKIISATLGAEKELLDAREQHAARMEDLAAKESALESARKALSDAESASYDDEEKRKDAIAKATEDASKAEDDLTEARKKSASALDMRIFDVAPQIHGMLSQAAAATTAIPALSGALGGLAVAAGPAGISVGVAVQAVMTGINLFKTVMGAISELVSGVFDARAKMFALQAQALQAQYEWAKTVDDMRAKVVELRVSWVEAQVALRDATWKTRLAQADVVRAQLQGVKTVAEAEAKLEAERKRVARAAARDLNDMSLLYDRYRWLEYQGLADRLDLAVTVTPEILALEAEVNAAKLTALANQRSASLAALQASWEQQKAALNLQQVQANLAMQTQQLALMQSQFGGFGQAESLQAMNTAKLYEERAKAQSQIGQSFWRLSYWLTGAGSADKQRIAELDQLIAEREANGQGAGAPGRGTGAMSFFGYGDSAMNAVKNGGYGAAEQAMRDFQEQQQLQQIELQKQQLEQQIEQNKLFVAYQKQIGDLTAEIEALKAGAASAQYTADSYREDNPAVKAALAALAQFEAGRASQYADVAAGRKQVVEITIPAQDMYTREQVDALLAAVQQVQSIDARVTVLETPAKPGANQVLQDISRRY
ncbi:phage tail tape measure protein [Corynebacterium sanguinis]|uniref:transglycosylase SLT domain-containing protein n=1 Tax=Corynebacterium sanguinis TaxID=2594913 RepID=UPI0021A88079|nr:transglycosylase SLT domain-containing protein [Corynebacterium sanguinis]MCT1491356.1 phage tail tape measure protein [Corynebacterium sanguinis]MCT2246725.1 phage tail tape measure protein [Corynebacterium sanguinis]